jgi:beta-N-acetylhexosaminidase
MSIAKKTVTKFSAALLALGVAATVISIAPADAQVPERVSQERAAQSVPDIIAGMTLEEKVGQLFMVPGFGLELETTDPAMIDANQLIYGVDNFKQLIEKYHLGGILYGVTFPGGPFTNNLDSPRQIAALSNDLQETALDDSGVPLLISSDQEQGLVMRTGEPTTQFPGNMALAATGRTKLARISHRVTAKEAKAMGINYNFAPVADVNSNPSNPIIEVRSFGSREETVSKFVTAAVKGIHDAGIAASAKHFPGHGDAGTDSHTGLPIIEHTISEFETIDLPPFKAAIDAGVDSIMTAHILVPSYDDSGLPATLSKKILTDLLRRQWDYDGVIVTDALTMEGVRNMFPDSQIPVEALKAGADMMLMPPEMDESVQGVIDAVNSGEITEKRINASVRRILKLKERIGLLQDPMVDEDAVSATVGTPKNKAQAMKVTRPSVTLLRNDAGTIPLAANSGSDVLVAGWGPTTLAATSFAVMQRGWAVEQMETGLNPDELTIDAAVSAAADKDVVLVNSNRAWANQGQEDLIETLIATGVPVVVLGVRAPYDVTHIDGVETYITTYGFRPVSVDAAVAAIFGEIDPSGTLPIDVPAADDANTIVYPFGFGL